MTTLLLALLLGSAPAQGPTPVQPPASADAAGALRGTIVDAIDFLPRQGVTLILRCDCEMQPRMLASADDGTFAFEGLAPGRYDLQLHGGDGVIEHGYAIAPGQDRTLVLAVEPERLPERDVRNLPVYRGYSNDARLRAAQVELSVGGVLLAGGLMMAVGAAVEAQKRDCPHGPQSCGAPPRRAVTRGLALGAGIATVTGGVLIGLGAHHRHRYRLGLSAGRDGGGVMLGGRF
jgi:hypothetical protein